MKKILLIFAPFIWALSVFAETIPDSIGVYAIKDGVAVRIEPINFHNTKVSAGFMSAKAKLEYEGSTSPHHFTRIARFRMFFRQPDVSDMTKFYMFAPNYSVKDFGVGKFEAKKDCRRLTTTKISPFGSTIGSSGQTKGVVLESVEVRPGVYDIAVAGKPGEYCLMHVLRGSAGYGGVFDFTIEP